MSILIILCLFACKSVHSLNMSSIQYATKLVDSLFTNGTNGYDSRFRPNFGGPPVEIEVQLMVDHIDSISEVNMQLTLNIFINQIWTDERLKFKRKNGIDELVFGAEVLKKIWSPDTYFTNEKISNLHIGTSTATNTLLRLKYDGRITYNTRMTVSYNCYMDLRYYPMDKQNCTLAFGSYGYTIKDIVYKWAQNKSLTFFEFGILLPQFVMSGCQIGRLISYTSNLDNFSYLKLDLHFSRSLGHYLIQVYIPASLIVIISWVPFWLDRDDCHARVALGVTTVLTITTLITNTNDALPKISYIKAIDVFLEMCFILVFAALLEYALIGYLGKKSGIRKHITDCTLTSDINENGKISDSGIELTKNIKSEENDLKKDFKGYIDNFTSDIDRFSRAIFPLIFFLFHLLYWVIYLNITEEFKTNIDTDY